MSSFAPAAPATLRRFSNPLMAGSNDAASDATSAAAKCPADTADAASMTRSSQYGAAPLGSGCCSRHSHHNATSASLPDASASAMTMLSPEVDLNSVSTVCGHCMTMPSHQKVASALQQQQTLGEDEGAQGGTPRRPVEAVGCTDAHHAQDDTGAHDNLQHDNGDLASEDEEEECTDGSAADDDDDGDLSVFPLAADGRAVVTTTVWFAANLPPDASAADVAEARRAQSDARDAWHHANR